MAGLQEYLERRSTEELQGMLWSYTMGVADIPVDSALRICAVLARRNPELPNPYVRFRSLCGEYCKK